MASWCYPVPTVGLSIRQFLHEGIAQMWADSLVEPGRHVSWVLIEEFAEGGDVLARRRERSPGFLVGFERLVKEGASALYRRVGVGRP
jgi:hypothetical protein